MRHPSFILPEVAERTWLSSNAQKAHVHIRIAYPALCLATCTIRANAHGPPNRSPHSRTVSPRSAPHDQSERAPRVFPKNRPRVSRAVLLFSGFISFFYWAFRFFINHSVFLLIFSPKKLYFCLLFLIIFRQTFHFYE